MNWHKASFSFVEKAEEAISNFCSTRIFLLLHILWFSLWIVKPVEPFPYGLLTMIVSLEAILLSTIIMINQRRHDAVMALSAENDKRIEEEKLDAILGGMEELFKHLPDEFSSIRKLLDTGAQFTRLQENTADEALRSVAIAAALYAQPGTLTEVKDKKKHDTSAN